MSRILASHGAERLLVRTSVLMIVMGIMSWILVGLEILLAVLAPLLEIATALEHTQEHGPAEDPSMPVWHLAYLPAGWFAVVGGWRVTRGLGRDHLRSLRSGLWIGLVVSGAWAGVVVVAPDSWMTRDVMVPVPLGLCAVHSWFLLKTNRAAQQAESL